MAIAVLGLLFGTAAIVIPRMVTRHNHPEDHSDSLAYLASTGPPGSCGHPGSWAVLKPVFEAILGARIDSDGTSLPMIALDLAGRRDP
jgi:hypothetical protein